MVKTLLLFISLNCCLVGKSCFAQNEFEKRYYFAFTEVVNDDEKVVYFSARLSYIKRPILNKTQRQFVTFLDEKYGLKGPKIKFTANKIGTKSPIRNWLDYRKAKFLTSEYYRNKGWKIVETDFGRED